MKWMSSLRSLLLVLMVATPLLLPAAAVSAGPPTQGVKLTPIGQPTWKPVDFHLFSAPIGTAATGYVEFAETALALLPPPKHAFNPVLLVGPGAPHPPPYDTELRDGVASLGYHEGVEFAVSEFSNGAGMYLVFMAVPAPGVVGSSPDFGSGPIIPNTLFPIAFTATNEHSGKPFSNVGIGSVPPLDENVGPDFAGLDGHSHFPMFFADNADFGPVDAKLRGSYRFRITITDQSGSGWFIEAHFTLAP